MVQYLLVDTDILIDVGRGINVAINRLQSEAKNSTLAISTITEMELIIGFCNNVKLQQLRKFLRYYPIFKVNESISRISHKKGDRSL